MLLRLPRVQGKVVRGRPMAVRSFLPWLLIPVISSMLLSQPLVAIQPLGKVDSASLAAAKAGIESLYNIRAEVLPAMPLPAAAYYLPRRRYRAERLLENLDSTRSIRYLNIVGLTASDISTTKEPHADWGIFGLGSLGGTSCVVSTHRLGKGKVPRKKFVERLIKVVNHELGHTLGLDHCPNRGCLMEDACGSIRTVDRESGKFCDSCRARIEKFVK